MKINIKFSILIYILLIFLFCLFLYRYYQYKPLKKFNKTLLTKKWDDSLSVFRKRKCEPGKYNNLFFAYVYQKKLHGRVLDAIYKIYFNTNIKHINLIEGNYQDLNYKAIIWSNADEGKEYYRLTLFNDSLEIEKVKYSDISFDYYEFFRESTKNKPCIQEMEDVMLLRHSNAFVQFKIQQGELKDINVFGVSYE